MGTEQSGHGHLTCDPNTPPALVWLPIRLDVLLFLLLLFIPKFLHESYGLHMAPTRTHQLGKPIFSGRYHSQFFGVRQVRGRDQRAIPGASVPDLPGLSRDFDCFDFSLEWDGMSGMEVVFDSLIFLAVLIV